MKKQNIHNVGWHRANATNISYFENVYSRNYHAKFISIQRPKSKNDSKNTTISEDKIVESMDNSANLGDENDSSDVNHNCNTANSARLAAQSSTVSSSKPTKILLSKTQDLASNDVSSDDDKPPQVRWIHFILFVGHDVHVYNFCAPDCCVI